MEDRFSRTVWGGLTHRGRHIGIDILSLDSALLDHSPALHSMLLNRRSRARRVLDPGQDELCDCPVCLVKHIPRITALGDDIVLGPCVGARNTRSGDGVSPARTRIPLHSALRQRISTDEHCTAKANIELIAKSRKRVDKLDAESGGVDAGMPVGAFVYSGDG